MGTPAQTGRLAENERIGRERAEAERRKNEAAQQPVVDEGDVSDVPVEREEETPA